MKQILLVEDDAWLAELYQDIFQQIAGVAVRWARDTETALELLNQKPVDLIVLDMFLPRHNGIEFLHEIASYTDTSRVPVVVLSAVHEHDFAMSPDRWRQYGVVEYLYKPKVKPQTLAAAVKKHLLKQEAST